MDPSKTSENTTEKAEQVRTFQPEAVIPFAYTQEDAMKACDDYYANRWLLPEVFRRKTTPEEMQGGFIPYLLYTGSAHADILCEAQDSKPVENDPKIVKQVRDYSVHRTGTVSYRRYQINASKDVPDEFMHTLEPFRYRDLTPIEETEEAALLEEMVDIEEIPDVRDRRLKETVEEAIRETVPHSFVQVTDRQIEFTQEKVECVLCPIWICTRKAGRHYYHFAMNGQTGKITGDLPVSSLKALPAFLGLFAAGAGIGGGLLYLIFRFLSGGINQGAVNTITIMSFIAGLFVSTHFLSILFEQMRKPRRKTDDLKHYASRSVHLDVSTEKLMRKEWVDKRNVVRKFEDFSITPVTDKEDAG